MSDGPNSGGTALLSLFQHIHIINLPHRTDRRREIEAELRRLGLAPDDARISVFPAIRPDAPGPFPTRGTRGCFLSHLEVLDRIARGSAPTALILEDDADFVQDVAARFPAITRDLTRQHWDIVYAGHMLDPPCDGAPQTRAVAPEVPVRLAHCIGMRRETAAAMRDYLAGLLERPAGSAEGGPMHVDGAYSWFRRAHPEIVTLALHPPIAVQRASPTDIHPRRWFDRIAGLAPAVALGRRLKRHIRRP